MLKNVQFPSLLMKFSDAVLKFHDSESFASWYFLPKTRPESITFFLSEQGPAVAAVQSSSFIQPVCEKSVVETDTQKCKRVKLKLE